MTSEEIARIKSLCDAATPGPWMCHKEDDGFGDPCEGYVVLFDATRERYASLGRDTEDAHDAAFIAEARTAVPALLAEVESLRARAEAAEAALEWVRGSECEDCNGNGFTGTTKDGKRIACETCGGHEDRLGTGFVPSHDHGAPFLVYMASLNDERHQLRADLKAERAAVDGYRVSTDNHGRMCDTWDGPGHRCPLCYETDYRRLTQ